MLSVENPDVALVLTDAPGFDTHQWDEKEE